MTNYFAAATVISAEKNVVDAFAKIIQIAYMKLDNT